MDRSSGFGSTPCDWTPYSDSLSLRLPYSVKLATECKSLTHYAKGTQSPQLDWPLTLDPNATPPHRRYAPIGVRLLGPSSGQVNPRTDLSLLEVQRPSRKARPAKDPKTNEAGAPTVCMHAVSGSISLPFRGSFRLSLTVLVHYRSITSI